MDTSPLYTNTYFDTRGLCTEPLTFTQAIVKGIAPGGGLFVPQVVPRLALDEILGLAALPYAQQAAFIYERFGVDLPVEKIGQLMATAYGDNFDTPEVAPVVEVAPNTHVLELWHGPTSAFKDMALQCLPPFFSASIDQLRGQEGVRQGDVRQGNTSPDASQAQKDYLILVATSGDTGKAALEGFRDRDHTGIVVFYPQGGVSDIQWRQMATQRGTNVGVFGVEGNFDSCQTAVKGAFSDEAFNKMLAREHGLLLSSANSINWGRLLPQIVYYVSAYARLVQSGALAPGDELDVCVPTGNFGNILACWYAKDMGVPVGRLLCASNENRVLADFINTGTYDIRARAFVLTPSPSMDILVSSNLERQLFELSGRDPEAIRGWMESLRTQQRFQVDRDTFAALRHDFAASWVSSDDSLATIKEVYDAHGYLLDPHTAVGWKVAERLRGENPVLIAATAHWAKFGADVYRALTGLPANSALPAPAQSLTGLELNALIAEKYGTGPSSLPARLAELGDLPIRFEDICGNTAASVEDAVISWLK
jgi:threonine synthase